MTLMSSNGPLWTQFPGTRVVDTSLQDPFLWSQLQTCKISGSQDCGHNYRAVCGHNGPRLRWKGLFL